MIISNVKLVLIGFFPCEQAAKKLGFPVLYGDGSRPAVLQSAGISSPKAVLIMYPDKKKTLEAVKRMRLAYPAVISRSLLVQSWKSHLQFL